MTHKELVDARLANDCRQALRLLGDHTMATWITFPVIRAQEGKRDGTR